MASQREAVSGNGYQFGQRANVDARTLADGRDRDKSGEPEPQPSAIVAASDGSIQFGDYTLTSIGLTLPDDITEDEWRKVGAVILGKFETSVSWAIGDWAEKAHKLWGWDYERISEESGRPAQTLMTYASICRAYPTLIRNQDASFGHHRVVAKFDNRAELVEYAVDHKWTVSQLQDFASPPKKKRPAPSRRDTYGGMNFAKNAQKLGKMVNEIGEGKKLTPKRQAEMLGYVQQIETWIEALKQSTFDQDGENDQ